MRFLSGLGLALTVGCTDPQGEFDTWLDKTNGVRGVVPDTGPVQEDTSASETDAATDTAFTLPDLTGTWFMSCLPSLVGGDASKSLIMYAEATLTGRNLAITVTPLLETATTMSKASTVPPTHSIMATVKEDGSWDATVGHVEVPGNSQRITDNNLVLENIVYHAHVQGPDRMCAELDGDLTAPIMSSLAPPGDVCIFARVAEGAPLPTAMQSGVSFVGFTAGEHHCP